MKTSNPESQAREHRPPGHHQAAARKFRIRAGHYSLLAAILDPEQTLSRPARRYRIIPRFRVSEPVRTCSGRFEPVGTQSARTKAQPRRK